ncbi:MAG: EscU/YscU/HrcU family type III secretion system export apparatus switch protein [bacterium]|nr:EscU/YscU/HrcU family type III secretion system export apparatus switch protein [bacterium]
MEEMRNKTAVALEYSPDEQAPKIIASGRGYLADKIVTAANESKVPVHQDAPLAKTLSKLEIGEYIPKELYGVVADILVYVDEADRIKKKLNLKK